MHESILGLSFVLGPLLGGIVANHYGSWSPYIICLGVIILGVVAQVIRLRERR